MQSCLRYSQGTAVKRVQQANTVTQLMQHIVDGTQKKTKQKQLQYTKSNRAHIQSEHIISEHMQPKAALAIASNRPFSEISANPWLVYGPATHSASRV